MAKKKTKHLRVVLEFEVDAKTPKRDINQIVLYTVKQHFPIAWDVQLITTEWIENSNLVT